MVLVLLVAPAATAVAAFLIIINVNQLFRRAICCSLGSCGGDI